MRHLQLKRSAIIYDNGQKALEEVKKQAIAMYRDTASTSTRVMRDGEPILASYRDEKAPGGVADILALLIKKSDGTDALFYIDSQNVLNKIGITVDGDINDLWLTELDSGEKTPIVIQDGEKKTVISAINDIAQYIAKDNGKIEDLLKKTITGLEDTDTIDFEVTPTEDGLKGNGNVKVSSDVEGNLLKVSGNTGLYVATSDIQSVAGAVDEITKTTDQTKFSESANTFTVKYANGQDPAIQQITYDSAMDSGLTTPNKIGGIAAGTTVQSLTGNSVSKILDMILFPEIFPTLGSPSVGVTPGGSSYEVGTTFPTFSVTTNRGKVTCPGQPDRYLLGLPTKMATYTGNTYTTAAETLPATVGYGTTNVHGYANFAQGDELKTSYGHTATKDVNGKPISQNPHPASAMTGGTSAVRGFYKYGGNMGSIDTIAKANAEAASNKKGNDVVKNGATVYNSALIVDYKSKEASKAGGLVDGNGGYVLALPSIMNITMRDVLQFNSGSGSWDASVKGDWEVFTPSDGDVTKFPGTLTDAAGNTYAVTYFKHKADSTALDGTGAARVSFAFVW